MHKIEQLVKEIITKKADTLSAFDLVTIGSPKHKEYLNAGWVEKKYFLDDSKVVMHNVNADRDYKKFKRDFKFKDIKKQLADEFTNAQNKIIDDALKLVLRIIKENREKAPEIKKLVEQELEKT